MRPSKARAADRWRRLADGAAWLERQIRPHRRVVDMDRAAQVAACVRLDDVDQGWICYEVTDEGHLSPLAAARVFLERMVQEFPEPKDPKADAAGFAVHRMASCLLEAVSGAEEA